MLCALAAQVANGTGQNEGMDRLDQRIRHAMRPGMGWQVRTLVTERHPSGTAIFAAMVRHGSDERQPAFTAILAGQPEDPCRTDI
ncbi:hypothetical protein D3C85_1831830 [compost metagenome]